MALVSMNEAKSVDVSFCYNYCTIIYTGAKTAFFPLLTDRNKIYQMNFLNYFITCKQQGTIQWCWVSCKHTLFPEVSIKVSCQNFLMNLKNSVIDIQGLWFFALNFSDLLHSTSYGNFYANSTLCVQIFGICC